MVIVIIASKDLLPFLPMVLVWGLPVALLVSTFLRQRRAPPVASPPKQKMLPGERDRGIVAIGGAILLATVAMFFQPFHFQFAIYYVGLFIAVAFGFFALIGSTLFDAAGRMRSLKSALRQLLFVLSALTVIVLMTPIGVFLFPDLPDAARFITAGVAFVLLLIAAFTSGPVSRSAIASSDRFFDHDAEGSSSSSSFEGGGGSGGGGGASDSW